MKTSHTIRCVGCSVYSPTTTNGLACVASAEKAGFMPVPIGKGSVWLCKECLDADDVAKRQAESFKLLKKRLFGKGAQ